MKPRSLARCEGPCALRSDYKNQNSFWSPFAHTSAEVTMATSPFYLPRLYKGDKSFSLLKRGILWMSLQLFISEMNEQNKVLPH